MGQKLERLMARVSALEEAFTQLLSENLRHGTIKPPAARRTKKAKAKKAAPKKKAQAKPGRKPEAAPVTPSPTQAPR